MTNLDLTTYQKKPKELFELLWPDIYLWDKLEEVLDAIVNNRRVVIPSGHGVGKTWLLARIALWFLYSFYPAKVITTAPTWTQVTNLLWSEIRKAHTDAKYPLGGRVLNTEIKIEEDWFAVGFATRGKATEREYGTPKFQGYHSENLIVLIDEAPGVEFEIWTSIKSLIVGENNRVIAGGNPTSASGPFYEACMSSIWKKINISSFDHPNVKTGQIVVPGAVTLDWINDMREEWGEDSPLWQTKVLGEFPTEGQDTLIPLAWAEACVGLDLGITGEKSLGCDVARFGDDKTVIAQFWGPTLQPLEAVNKKDTNWTIGRIKSLTLAETFDHIGIDDSGVGGGVTDGLFAEDIDVDAMNFGSEAIESDKFENLKAEIFWNLREAIKHKQISLPHDMELINQLCSLKFNFTRKGKIKIESKADMKKRGLKSPDKADAVAIAFSAGRMKQVPTLNIISVDES